MPQRSSDLHIRPVAEDDAGEIVLLVVTPPPRPEGGRSRRGFRVPEIPGLEGLDVAETAAVASFFTYEPRSSSDDDPTPGRRCSAITRCGICSWSSQPACTSPR